MHVSILRKKITVGLLAGQHEGVNQTALVVLNKSNAAQSVTLDNMLIPGKQRDAANNKNIYMAAKQSSVKINVPGNGARVLLLDQVINNPDIIQAINASMAAL